MKVAISDIHGHYDELLLLYHKILHRWNFNPKEDQLIFLGDYVDGGYETKNVITWLIRHKEQYPHWVFLYGNHEDLMLQGIDQPHYSNEFELWYQQGGRATAFSYVPKNKQDSLMQLGRHATSFIYKKHREWLSGLPLYYEDDNYIFVHAGINPRIWKKNPGMDKQTKHDMIWIRDPFIQSTRSFNDKKVIYGHTARQEPDVRANKIGIDTMFHNRGKLTAIRLPQEDFIFQESVTEDRPRWNKDLIDGYSIFF